MAQPIDVDTEVLREAIQDEYKELAGRNWVFDGAPQASSASKFGTVGINFRADKPPAMD